MKKFNLNLFTFLSLGAIIVIATFKFECSPLYQGATWVDTNTVYDMANGLLHGKVPFKDIFDTKGPILYFIYALAIIITPGQYWGLWILEIVFGVATFFILRAIYKLVSKNIKLLNNYADIVAFLGWVLIYTSWPIHKGGSAEEFATPAILYLIYITIKVFSDQYSNREILIVGALFALVFWIKYSLILCFAGFFVFYGLYLLVKRNWAGFGKTVGFSLAGFGIGSLPTLIYFTATGALGDLWNNYFIVNLTKYNFFNSQYNASYPDQSPGARVKFFLYNIYAGYIESYQLAILGIILVILAYIFVKNRLLVTVLLFQALLGLGGEYWTIRWLYYFAIAFPYIVSLLAMVAVALLKKLPKNKRSILANKPTQIAAFIVVFALAFPISYTAVFHSGEIDGRQFTWDKSQAQSLVADKIKELQPSNPTALVWGYIDSGFLYRAGIAPSNYFFDSPQFFYKNYPEMYDEQLKYIQDKSTDFVVSYGANAGYNQFEENPDKFEEFTITDIVTGQTMSVPVPKVLKENYEYIEGYTTTDPDHAPWSLWKKK